MFVDAQTLRDLEIFRSRDGGPSLCDAVNRTRTGLGDHRLREWLSAPKSDPSVLAARIESIAFLARSWPGWSLDRYLAQDVEGYLGSRYATLESDSGPGAVLEALWVGLRHRPMALHARNGVQAVRRLLEAVTPPVRRILTLSPPEELAGLCREMLAQVQILAAAAGSSGGAVDELRADRRLRVDRRHELRRFLGLIGRLDALLSGAALLAEGYTLPRIETGDAVMFEATGIWHPFLPDAVRNPVTLRNGETLVFLTGPNMAGKSTYLRSVSACIYLAHCGYPVPAARLAISPVEALFTSISPEDHLRSGLSFFMAEVRRVREVLEAVADGRRSIAVFDEVFRGTNVHDAMEASREVIRGCARARHSGFLFSSHLVELAGDLAREPAVRFLCFDADIRGEGTVFDYALRDGVSDRRFGMELLRREGVPELLARIPGAGA